MIENAESALPRSPYDPFPSFSEWTRSAPDLSYVDQLGASFDAAREAVEPSAVEALVDQATRWAAVDTGALEGLYDVDRGFTFSVAKSVAAWENIHEVKGQAVERVIRDHLAGYELVLDLATTRQPITESIIKNLHAVLCASQDTYQVVTDQGVQDRELIKGEYKTESNSPFNFDAGLVHSYAPPIDVIPEMHRLVEEMRSSTFQSAHSVLQASFAHYAFVCIHPFPDGNGRVSRALASAFSYRSPGVPLVIFKDQKNVYIDALEAADRDDKAPFITFVGERVVDTMRSITAALRAGAPRSIEDRLEDFIPSLEGRGGLAHDELNAIGSRLTDLVLREADEVITASKLRPPVSAGTYPASGTVSAPDGYRMLPRDTWPGITVSVEGVGFTTGRREIYVAVALPSTPGPDFVIHTSTEVIDDVYLREIDPSVSQALTFRMRTVLEGVLYRLVDDVLNASTKALRQQGYLE